MDRRSKEVSCWRRARTLRSGRHVICQSQKTVKWTRPETYSIASHPPSKHSSEDRDLVTKLVIPETFQGDFLHHYHSCKGNTGLLTWTDLFTDYAIAKASASRTALTIAENYEECTLTRFVKMYVSDVNQRDWDGYGERLTFALNTAQDRVRGDTPFYLVHGWDPRTPLEAKIPLGSTRRRDFRPHEIEVGMQAWLYLDKVKEGYARKLAHIWHGPFKVAEVIITYAVRLEFAGTEYRLFPIVHVAKLKPVRGFPYHPSVCLTTGDQDRLDFDEGLLPEDSWDVDLAEDEYVVERIADMRSGRRTVMGAH
ncbi:hypothetical protein ON010_g17989 [Phytophthora cinnamomi]|nr:hypothetical protein ON010_g17989 [Phytophthora cinnamomi]